MAALLTGGLGVGMGALAGPPLAELLLSRTGNQLPDLPDDIRSKIRKRFGITGFLLGASPWLFPLYKNIQEKGFAKGLFGSMGEVQKPAYITKRADLIPMGPALEVLGQDQYLSLPQKLFVSEIFGEAASHAAIGGSKLHGLLSTNDLIAGALGAGLGYGTGYVAGNVLSQIFALPSESVRKLSRTGELAGFLYGAGIIS